MASMNKIFSSRKNCLVIDVVDAFPGDIVPTQEWVDFLVECLKLDFDKILSSYIYQKTNLLMVTVNSEEVFESVLQSLEQGVLWTKYKKKVFGWSATTVTTPVTVVNLPFNLDLNLINNLLSKWGTITKGSLGYLKETGYKVADGTYHLKMVLKENTVLPSVIDVPSIGEQFLVFSTASKKICLNCTKVGHISRYCRFQQRTPAASNPSWARIVEEGMSVKNPNPPPTLPPPVNIETPENQEMNLNLTQTNPTPEMTGGATPTPAPPTSSSLENVTPPCPLPPSTPLPPSDETLGKTNPHIEAEPEKNKTPPPPRPTHSPGDGSESEDKGNDEEGWETRKMRSGRKRPARTEHKMINKEKLLQDLSVKKSNVVKKL